MRMLAIVAGILASIAAADAQTPRNDAERAAQPTPAGQAQRPPPAPRQQPAPPAETWRVMTVPDQVEAADFQRINQWLGSCRPDSSRDVMGVVAQRVATEGVGARYTTTLFCKPGKGGLKDVQFKAIVWDGAEEFQKTLDNTPVFAILGYYTGGKDLVFVLQGAQPPARKPAARR